MNISIKEPINGNPALRQQVFQAGQMLANIIGLSSEFVTGEWDIVQDANKVQPIRLVLTDLMTKVRAEARFSQQELASEGFLSAKLYRIWGDLLQFRSHRQLDGLSGQSGTSKV